MFAGAYVALQVGRNVAQLLLLHRGEPLRPLFQGVVVWSCASGILWIAGAYLVGESLVRLRLRSSLSRRRLVAVIALVLLDVLGRQLPALALSAGVAAILAVLTAWDREHGRSAIQDGANLAQVSA